MEVELIWWFNYNNNLIYNKTQSHTKTVFVYTYVHNKAQMKAGVIIIYNQRKQIKIKKNT